MWHVTRDTWHMTRDTLLVTLGGGWTICKNFRSLALLVWPGKWFEDLEEKDQSLNQLINDEAVYRTAPATPGLLNMTNRKSGTGAGAWVGASSRSKEGGIFHYKAKTQTFGPQLPCPPFWHFGHIGCFQQCGHFEHFSLNPPTPHVS